jgi:uncharacterized protein (DUF1778 family)
MSPAQDKSDNVKPPRRKVERLEMRLNARDSKAFVAILLDEAEPGERLKAAYERYKRRVGAR